MPTPIQQAQDQLAIAQSYRAEGNRAMAEVVLQQLLQKHPSYDPALHFMGLMALEAGDLPSAIDWMGKAIVQNPNQGAYHRNRGELCRRVGRLDDAVSSGERAVALLPGDADSHFNLALAHSDRSDWNPAVATFQAAIALRHAHSPSWNGLGVALGRLGQAREAQKAYQEAVQIDPGNAQAHFNLGIAFRQQGRLEDARVQFATVQRLDAGLLDSVGMSADVLTLPITPSPTEVRETGTAKGRGVFAGRNFAAGEVVETSPIVLLHGPYDSYPQEVKSIVFNWGSLCGLGDAHAIALGYGSLFNHDNPANTEYSADPANLRMQYRARRAIAAGEELTINYNDSGGVTDGAHNHWFTKRGVNVLVSGANTGPVTDASTMLASNAMTQAPEPLPPKMRAS